MLFKKNFMPSSRKKKLGVGAACSTCLKHLRPRAEASSRHPNKDAQDCIDQLMSKAQETQKSNSRDIWHATFSYERFDGIDARASKHHGRVNVEGPSNSLFTDPESGQEEEKEEAQQLEPIAAEASCAGANSEDTALAGAQGAGADDDNDPAPENAPQPSPL